MPSSPHPGLNKWRMALALAVAISIDFIQLVMGPLGWFFIDEVLDLITCGIEILLLGFHPLLLPTVLVEFIPVVDMLPTWTGCVLWVIFARRKKNGSPPPFLPPGERSNRE